MVNMRPMLAASFDDPQNFEPELRTLQYPMLASPKVDGIRWMKPTGEKAKSRSWKDLPNEAFQQFMQDHAKCLDFLDGEVITGDVIARPYLFNLTQSHIMTREGNNPFTVYVFDMWYKPDDPFKTRTRLAQSIVEDYNNPVIKYLPHRLVNSPIEVLGLEEECLEAGYEGLMLRSPTGTYKFGRSTLKQQGLIKIKRYVDDEAQIVGFEELERNQNEPTQDAFGLQKRSSHKAGKIAGGTLGKFVLNHPKWGEFTCGSGLDDETRAKVWASKEEYLGKMVTFKYQPHGMKDKPRTPIFKGFRSD